MATKLTESEVREIRQLADTGMSYPKIGQRVGISSSQASLIARGKQWKDVGGPIQDNREEQPGGEAKERDKFSPSDRLDAVT